MRSVSQSNLHDYCIDILWICAHVFNKSCPNWSGYMSSLKINDHPLTKSVITMLPVINLHATDTTALYSLLSFVTDQSSKINVPTPPITFDQPLYVKAYNIVSSMNVNVFARLGGFHQLMRFLGSTGCWMEESGLCAALENVYAPVTVGHVPVQYVVICLCFSSFITSLRRVLGYHFIRRGKSIRKTLWHI